MDRCHRADTDMEAINTIWIGSNYPRKRIFVLGESWYGDYVDNTDAGYIRLYLDGKVTDSMYTRMANACGMSRHEFWNGIIFTNYVQRVGDTRNCRPDVEAYRAAASRLAFLLERHRPSALWILGIGQAEYSAPVVEAAGIPFEITAHPTSFGLTNAALGESWNRLIKKLGNEMTTVNSTVIGAAVKHYVMGERK